MREGWVNATIGEVCQLVNGGTPKTKVNDFWDGPHAWITPAEMGKLDSPNVSETSRTLTDEGLSKSSANLLPPKSLILSSRAPIGHLVINEVPMATNQGCKGLIPKKSLYYKYLYYFLFSAKELLNDLGTGTTFNWNYQQLGSKAFLYLSLLFQNKSASLPFSMKHLRGSRRQSPMLKRISPMRASCLKVSLMLSSSRRVKVGSSATCLIFAMFGMGLHDSPKYVDDGIPFVTQKNIREDGLSFEKTKYISEADHINFYRRSNVTQGDILISMIGANRGMACLVDDSRIFSIKNVGLVKSTDDLNMRFLLYYLKTDVAKRYVESESRGGAQSFIGLGKLRSFPVVIAPKEVQEVVVTDLDRLRTQVGRLEVIYQRKLATLAALKNSLLRKTFAGELTAKVITSPKEEAVA